MLTTESDCHTGGRPVAGSRASKAAASAAHTAPVSAWACKPVLAAASKAWPHRTTFQWVRQLIRLVGSRGQRSLELSAAEVPGTLDEPERLAYPSNRNNRDRLSDHIARVTGRTRKRLADRYDDRVAHSLTVVTSMLTPAVG